MKKVIIDENGNEQIVELTKNEKEELAQLHADFLIRKEAIKAELDAKNAAKAAAEAKLAALGLTADDLKALGLGSN